MLQTGCKCKHCKQQKENNTSELRVINFPHSLIDVSAHSQLAKITWIYFAALRKSTYHLVNWK